MKKFVKVSLITAGSMLLIGFLMVLIAGFAGGRTVLHEIRRGLLETRLERLGWEWDRGDFHFVWDDKDSISSHTRSHTLTVNGKQEDSSGVQYEIEAAQVKSLDFLMGAGKFTLTEKETDDGKISLYMEGNGNCTYEVKENTLYIEGFSGIQEYKNVGEWNQMEIHVPRGSSFREVDVEIGAGLMNICNLTIEEFDAEVGAGEMSLSDTVITELDAEIGMGSLIADGVQSVNANISVDMGKVDFDGGISGYMEVENAVGSVYMLLDGAAEDHNYVIECKLGSIEIEDYFGTAVAAQKTISQGKDSTYNISCDMGLIEIDFRE